MSLYPVIDGGGQLKLPGLRFASWLLIAALVAMVEMPPSTSSVWTPNVKPEDYLYYLDLKEQMFGMK